jgi:hypothetical protein
MIRKHVVLSGASLLIGVFLVWWIQPNTTGGTLFVMTFCFVIVNALGAFAGLRPGRLQKARPVRNRTTGD